MRSSRSNPIQTKNKKNKKAKATGQDGTTLSYNTKSSNESKKQLEIAVETARLKVAMEAATRRLLRRIDTDDESGDELRIFSHDAIINVVSNKSRNNIVGLL